MTSSEQLNLLAYTFLNPFYLTAFLFLLSDHESFLGFNIKAFYHLPSNSKRINLVVYAGFCLLATLLTMGFKLVVLLPLAVEDISPLAFIAVDGNWLCYIGYVVSLFTLKALVSKDGLEWNVAGFIFFPFLILGMVLQGINHILWLLERVI